VAFRIGGISEVVVDGECGFLHSFGDTAALGKSVGFLADNPQRAEEMGRNGLERAKEYFTTARIVPQYEALYRRVIR
jgi:glycosyltransferase involved in cell wall biosynthesis